MIVAVTGHRPQKLGGFKTDRAEAYVKVQTQKILEDNINDIDYFCSGMALGVDQWTLEVALDLGIKTVACVPFKQQALKWNRNTIATYDNLISQCHKVVNVDRSPGYLSTQAQPDFYHVSKLFTRNIFMIDKLKQHGGFLIAFIREDLKSSGSHHAMKYAQDQGVPVKLGTIHPSLTH